MLMHLYPSINIDRVNELYQLCDIYLDINEGNEILNAGNKRLTMSC